MKKENNDELIEEVLHEVWKRITEREDEKRPVHRLFSQSILGKKLYEKGRSGNAL